ncbi:uncharacterized protein LOC131687113 [Topomyia yanbarensis]|uniref:uncharacterized protein LOC131687113 n=1 Tax=Topomyia yanbarensis TaxID=2498891 RepID=UPI00273BD295|nr:uncharacterized protein LOC131687113 [Topomyia yanbarensis]
MLPNKFPLGVGLLLAAILVTIDAGPMYYKKISGQKYEPDWVAVSSTVIPLTEYRLSVGAIVPDGLARAASIPDEYRRAYQRHKKLTAVSKLKLPTGKSSGREVAPLVQENPDTLITANKKFYEKKLAGN